ncbi:hypothetical protein GIB67_023096 [Kingdonia uniflora]|uniref:RING-type domain-containing protein n=1 Tax=Kingdonia uniflora TaxID=39325 RepID=A0A7J7M5G7_9MAGN|nr:hypothetical protein GIB67_023096 [Kingdonia uniflora]
MNNTTGDSGLLSDNIGGFGYGIGVSIGILLLITTITLASYFCTRSSTTVVPQPQRRFTHDIQHYHHGTNIDLELGVDEATLRSYPKLLYSDVKGYHGNKDSTSLCCSICLADYKGNDMLRLLPDCEHLFHLSCVDPWLRQNPTCPVCRSTSPMPSPLSTPLAEVAPLASRPV